MDALLPTLLDFPPHPPPPVPLTEQKYDEGINAQIAYLKKIPKKDLLGKTSGRESLLDVINPALNSVPYLYVLCANISATKDGKKVDVEGFSEKMVAFLTSFDARQIRYAGSEFIKVVEALASLAEKTSQPSLVIDPIRDALLRLDPTTSVLSSIHLLLIKIALRTRCYDAVTPVLDNCVLYFPGATFAQKTKYLCDPLQHPTAYLASGSGFAPKFLKSLDILEYFYSCGIIYIGARKWEMAQEYLENTITYPTKSNGVSKIQVEAYKKWVLVGLMLGGQIPRLPKNTNDAAAKIYHIIARPYESVGVLFNSASAERLRHEVQAGAHIWDDDNNTGLMTYVLAEFQKWQIRNLSNVYSQISVSQIWNITETAEEGKNSPTPDELLQIIQNMISNGSLNANLSNHTTTVELAVLTFSPASVTLLPEAEVGREMQAATHQIQMLNQEIIHTDRHISQDKDYIKVWQKQKANAKKLSTAHNDAHEMDLDQFEDEDIMATY